MGKYNSSTYRVAPFVKEIQGDLSKINQFLEKFNVKIDSLPTCYLYGDNEKLLKPAKQHLLKLIEYFSKTEGVVVPTMNKDRELLLLGSKKERETKKREATRLLDENYDKLSSTCKDWYIFEGFTHPDLFIEGEDYILIGEGKWTESHITTSTTNLPKRNQMARHIQAARNNFNKRIYAFYLVDEKCGYLGDLTPDAFRKQLAEETISIDEAEKEVLIESFVGYITWQEINKIFPDIKFLTKEEIDKK